MTRPVFIHGCLSGLCLCVLSLAANAGPVTPALGTKPINAVMPAGVDPNFFDLNKDGDIVSFTGDYLLPTMVTGGLGGADIRAGASTISTFRSLVFTFDYKGGFTFTPLSNFMGISPWDVSTNGIVGSGEQVLFTESAGSVAIGDPNALLRYYADFAIPGAANLSSAEVTAITQSHVIVQGFTSVVPEPGLFALVISAAAGAGILRRKRRTRGQ